MLFPLHRTASQTAFTEPAFSRGPHSQPQLPLQGEEQVQCRHGAEDTTGPLQKSPLPSRHTQSCLHMCPPEDWWLGNAFLGIWSPIIVGVWGLFTAEWYCSPLEVPAESLLELQTLRGVGRGESTSKLIVTVHSVPGKTLLGDCLGLFGMPNKLLRLDDIHNRFFFFFF